MAANSPSWVPADARYRQPASHGKPEGAIRVADLYAEVLVRSCAGTTSPARLEAVSLCGLIRPGLRLANLPVALS